MTDFMAFVSSSIETLESSNYSVLLALPHISPSSLLSNIGFFFSLSYFGSFILFSGLTAAADSKARSHKNLSKRFKE